MKHAKFIVLLLALALAPERVIAATPAQTAPGYEPTLGADVQGPYPASLPQYLPDGAVNLNEAWVLYGGARPYWNSVYIPRQLNLNGATWVDPASVPDLFQRQQVQKRTWRPVTRKVVRKRVAKATTKPPRRAVSRKLTPPAIPLPVTPVPQNNVIEPLTAVPGGAMATTPIEPPRLQ